MKRAAVTRTARRCRWCLEFTTRRTQQPAFGHSPTRPLSHDRSAPHVRRHHAPESGSSGGHTHSPVTELQRAPSSWLWHAHVSHVVPLQCPGQLHTYSSLPTSHSHWPWAQVGQALATQTPSPLTEWHELQAQVPSAWHVPRPPHTEPSPVFSLMPGHALRQSAPYLPSHAIGADRGMGS